MTAPGESPLQRPQPGELWSTAMVARYGKAVLDLEAAFQRVLRSAPPSSAAEAEHRDHMAFYEQTGWPDWYESDLRRIFQTVRDLSISGAKKKIERIELGLVKLSAVSESGRAFMLSQGKEELDSAHQSIVDLETANLVGEIRSLHQHVSDELDELCFLVLGSGDTKLYEAKEPLFGLDVYNKFPDSRDDVEEAGKCLALRRSKAAVCHLMLAMEEALRVLAVAAGGVTIKDSNDKWLPWLKLTENLANQKIKPMPEGDEKAAWLEVHTMLTSVGRAWRNPTMHPAKSYSEEQAKKVFEAVRGFMADLAAFV
jgi:hypothetical protein